ncbi:putative mitogen-activated protein kinase kinase kinase 7-like isoform X2 [Drosophila innubila]|uniref:putative mitogen-activated protein kinase kinase kinase 7-like isoform X2 n=1 Tax=Drosophila innubila TaxID=198719 RepID=UPI00148B5F1D|nr:putative mitogen-activated protein kinase kinase kinase 7-like isoform X2 [Drosophila innubila]
MEYADCGSLDNVLHGNNRNMKYSYYDAIFWMLQCVKGMAYMHDSNIIHHDLKPSKLLFVHNLQTLKIGSSNCMTEVGSLSYMAPEVISNQKYTEKCDVYSFGIILWEIMSRKKPHYHLSQVSSWVLMQHLVKGNRPDLNDVNIFANSDPIKDLISKCWDSDPKKRPSMKDLIVILGNLLPST